MLERIRRSSSVQILAAEGGVWNTGVRGEAAVALVQVGGALVIAPYDETFSAVTQRLEARLHAAGSDVEELITAAAEARAQIVREEFDVGEEG